MSRGREHVPFTKDLPMRAGYDLAVCGGGPAGIPAALAAARAGLKVLLIEGTGQLGGVGTSAGVTSLLGGWTATDKQRCVGGIFQEIADNLIQQCAAVDPMTIPNEDYQPFGWAHGALASGLYFDPIAMVSLLDDKMVEAGVDVLYYTAFVDAAVEDERITHLVLHNKSGLFAVPVRGVVDATGDGDVAARSGCEFLKGRDEDGLMTPATLMFTVDGVDQRALSSYMREHRSNRLRELIRTLRDRGEWPFDFDIFISQQTPEPGTFMINTSRICNVDGTDGVSVSRGVMEGRRQISGLFRIMREHFPGFEHARIRNVAPSLGVRETRRIVGDLYYTTADVLEKRDFDDTIGLSGYGFDLPDPKAPSHQPVAGKVKLPRPWTPIPYRIMAPHPVSNLICAGRCVSVERDVLGILRVMAPCYAMGQAAGLAAVQVVREDRSFHDVNTDQLRKALRQVGAIVDAPNPTAPPREKAA